MNLLELFLLAVGLSMDAFAVSICKGLSMNRVTVGKAVSVGLYFGAFQAGMPLLGYFLGLQFRAYITAVDHWIAFFLLGFLGINMIREALRGPDMETKLEEDLRFSGMLVLSVATSIDALAVGIPLAFLHIDIVPAVFLIGTVTFTLSALGVKVGNLFGTRYESKAELAGGIILIGMGLDILLEHLGIFP
ncbi:MAG: manganese efflux pump MntP family protein [Intestinimonas sp.]|jgi:putative Mn2+ efflux pump MntP|nr:manganese efflux pump MntP family protein [Intestinimonas sp.]